MRFYTVNFYSLRNKMLTASCWKVLQYVISICFFFIWLWIRLDLGSVINSTNSQAAVWRMTIHCTTSIAGEKTCLNWLKWIRKINKAHLTFSKSIQNVQIKQFQHVYIVGYISFHVGVTYSEDWRLSSARKHRVSGQGFSFFPVRATQGYEEQKTNCLSNCRYSVDVRIFFNLLVGL